MGGDKVSIFTLDLKSAEENFEVKKILKRKKNEKEEIDKEKRKISFRFEIRDPRDPIFYEQKVLTYIYT